MINEIKIQNVALRLQEPEYFIDQFLLRGTYSLIITVPFDTRIVVQLQNPVPGFIFLADADTTTFIWNSRLQVPANGQYRFLIRLDRPILSGEIQVQFIRLNIFPDDPPPPPDETPPWPPIGSAAQIWDKSHYQAIIRRLHPLWVAEKNKLIKSTHGPGWSVDPWGRGVNLPFNPPSGTPPDGIGGGDAPMWCWFNLSSFQEWIKRNGP